jgi:hypothetical protein
MGRITDAYQAGTPPLLQAIDADAEQMHIVPRADFVGLIRR